MEITRRQVLASTALGAAAAPLVLAASAGTARAATPAASLQLQDELLLGVVFEDPTLAAARLKFTDSAGSVSWRIIERSAHGKDGELATASDPVAISAEMGAVELDPAHVGRARLGAVDGKTSLFAPQRRSTGSGTVDFLGIPVVSRSMWGADESLMQWSPEFSPTQILTVHHSVIAPKADDVASTVRAIYQLHAVTNDWGDIGYHLLIGPDGTVFAGRSTGNDRQPVFQSAVRHGQVPSGVTAAHSGGFNTGNIGICVLGDFTTKQPTAAAYDSLLNVLARLCHAVQLNPLRGVWPIPPVAYQNPVSGEKKPNPAISRHRDWNTTECPGNAFATRFDLLRPETTLRMAMLGLLV